MFSEKKILKALSTVDDPDLKKDLVSLGMIENIKIEQKKIYFDLVLTTPACPLKELLKKQCIEALEKEIGIDIEIFINIRSQVSSARQNTPILPQVKNIIAVASGKGGVGKSTVTANLALSLSRLGAKVGIIDADIFGPSMPTMFKAEGMRPGLRKKGDKTELIPIEINGIKLLSIGFLTQRQEAIVWRGPMASSALRQFITDAYWGDLDYLLIDLPPGTSDIHLTLVQTAPLTGSLIVTTPQKVALEDAERGIDMFRKKTINVPILGLVENMAYFTPEELPNNKYYIFGKDGGKLMAESQDIPFLGQIPLIQSIRQASDDGELLGLQEELTGEFFTSIAKNLAQQVSIRNSRLPKTEARNG